MNKTMRNPKAEMFNSKASDSKNKPDNVLKALELQRGQNVADVGAGGGYFTLRFAEIVGTDGRVFAVDTDQIFLDFVEKSAKEKGLVNVETVLAAKDTAPLPERRIDLIFMRNVCHHLANRPEYFKKLNYALWLYESFLPPIFPFSFSSSHVEESKKEGCWLLGGSCDIACCGAFSPTRQLFAGAL